MQLSTLVFISKASETSLALCSLNAPKISVESRTGEQSHLLQWTARWPEGVEHKDGAVLTRSAFDTSSGLPHVHLSARQRDAVNHSPHH